VDLRDGFNSGSSGLTKILKRLSQQLETKTLITVNTSHLRKEQTMPRPARKPKRFNPQPQLPSEEVIAPVASTPVRQRQSTTGIASPGLSPIQRENNFTIYEDENDPESDGFGFSKVKGIKKLVNSPHIESEVEESLEEDDHDIDDNPPEDDEDIYGIPLPSTTKQDQGGDSINVESSPMPAPVVQAKPKKQARKLRTSQLLPLLPARRKRQQSSNSRKKMASINTSEPESDSDIPVKMSKPVKRRRVADKENDGPMPSDEEDAEDSGVVERRKIVKEKFAKVDEWEMAFETVDLSFSSQ
jgi:hypothetical protein